MSRFNLAAQPEKRLLDDSSLVVGLENSRDKGLANDQRRTTNDGFTMATLQQRRKKGGMSPDEKTERKPHRAGGR